MIGSVGPGTKLPTLGHVPYARCATPTRRRSAGCCAGGVHAVLVETAQDLLQAKAAVIGAKRALPAAGSDAPLMCQVTVETTGTMLLGSEIGAALTALEPLGIDVLGLNCATGPDEMSEHLRHLSRHARVPCPACPTPGCRCWASDGASYPLTPRAARRRRTTTSPRTSGWPWSVAAAARRPSTCARSSSGCRVAGLAARRPRPEAGVASLYQHVPFRQDTSYLSIGERTNANGSLAFKKAMLEERWDDCIEIARDQTRDGAHLLDVCIDYVGRDGVEDMKAIACRFATASTLPLVLDSTEPAVIEAGLELLGGRSVVNSVNYEDGDGPGSRFARVMPIVQEHGAAVVALCIDEEGQARTAEWKVRVATRLIEDLTTDLGHAGRGHRRRLPHLPDRPPARRRPAATGWRRSRRSRQLKRALPDGADDARRVQRVLRPQPGGPHRAELGVPPRVRQGRPRLGDRARGEDPADVEDPGGAARGRARPGLRPPPRGLRPAAAVPRPVRGRRRRRACGRAGPRSWPALPLGERLARRIIDGERNGLEADLQAALDNGKTALDIVNDHLLEGMKVVGELFGKGEMQLPFVLSVGRGDEDRGGLARAAHGEDRRGRARAPSSSPRSRATCTTSARTWSTSSCPTTGTPSSTSASSSRCRRSSRPPTRTAPTSSGCPACW